MKQKIASLLIISSLLFSQASFVVAQTLDTTASTTDTTTVDGPATDDTPTEPVSEPEPEPVVE